MKLLSKINSPEDLKKLTLEELQNIARELRSYIIDVVSTNGGHLASSLGVVELTIALHYVFNEPLDKIIWDVGHQCYPHKILTGRRDEFRTIRLYKGLSGFPRVEESPYDHFNTGHSSTSISAALGYAVSRDFVGKNNKVIAVVGDGALSAGLAFEGLNNAGASNRDLIVILNDNKISISKNVGALSKYLVDILADPFYNKIKDEIWQALSITNFTKELIRPLISRIDESIKNILTPGLLFEKLGFRYFGPIDGHDIEGLVNILNKTKNLHGPLLIHVLTQKGKGLDVAEQDYEKYHGVKGTLQKPSEIPSYTSVFSKTIVKLGKMFDNIVTITAAMGHHGGLSEFAKEFPDRFFDVGIAEQHALTFAAALSMEKHVKPVVMIYNTFLQRAYDSLIHDVTLHKANVLLAIDRTGLVGADGPTHHGTFGFTYLRAVPNIVIAAPRDENMEQHLLYTGVKYKQGPFAVLYPRGTAVGVKLDDDFKEMPIGKAEILKEGDDILFVAFGSMVQTVKKVADILEEKLKLHSTIVDLVYLKPLDEELLRDVFSRKCAKHLVIAEENTLCGGVSAAVLEFCADNDISLDKVLRIGIPDRFITHGSVYELYEELNLLPEQIALKAVKKFYPKKVKKLEEE